MIHTQGLGKLYGQHTALESLDLEVRRGELFCYLGPNGAGKTTTIKMLTGLIRPSHGRAAIGGFDLVEQPIEAKRLLGYVPDRPYLYERLSGRELLRFVAGLRSMPADTVEERCQEMLETFSLGAVAERMVEGYSHGMRQKLAFAACFLHRPEVVVIDEPWVGLDPESVHRVKAFLRRETGRGTTIFLSTHTLSIAEEMADRIGILHRGQLRAVGTVEETKALASEPGSLESVFLELTRSEPEHGASPP